MGNFNLTKKIKHFFRGMNIAKRNLLLTSLYIIVTGTVLIISSYYTQQTVFIKKLHGDSEKTMEVLKDKVTVKDVKEAMETTNENSAIHQKLTAIFDGLTVSNTIANVYIYGTELEDGEKTSIIALTTGLLDSFAEKNVKLGDYYVHPAGHTAAVKEMLNTKHLAFTEPYTDEFGTWVSALYPFIDDNNEVIAYMGIDIDASLLSYSKHILLMISLITLAITLAVILTLQYFTTKRTFKPVHELMNALEETGNGNFTVQLKSGDDEFGQVNNKFNMTVNHINELVGTIKTAAEHSTDQSKILFSTVESSNKSALEIIDKMKSMAESAKVQSSSIADGAVSLEEISSVVSLVAKSMTELSEISIHMKSQSELGNQNIERVIDHMNAIYVGVKESVKIIEKLKQRSVEIGQIVQVITDIAGQTNLLSLNASIEAARAGEEGRGFAVVANEVKKLANESKKSAAQITELIQQIQEETALAVTAIRDGEEKVDAGICVVRDTGLLFEEILHSTDSVVSQIQEVSAASQQMAAETEQVTFSIKKIAEFAKTNSAFSAEIQDGAREQIATYDQIYQSAEELKQVSSEMKSIIHQLIIK